MYVDVREVEHTCTNVDVTQVEHTCMCMNDDLIIEPTCIDVYVI